MYVIVLSTSINSQFDEMHLESFVKLLLPVAKPPVTGYKTFFDESVTLDILTQMSLTIRPCGIATS